MRELQNQEWWQVGGTKVGVAKRAIKLTHGIDINVRKHPRDKYSSHTCIEGYSANNEEVTTTLSDMVREDCLYLGCTTD